MEYTEQIDGFEVVGIALRTSNDVADRTIPPFWGRFIAEGILQKIPGRVNDDIHAVYTRFVHPGVDNSGEYTFVIGAQVEPRQDAPDGMVKVTVPASTRLFFPVTMGRPDLVGERWVEIWNRQDLAKTFISEYERHAASGEIVISIGVEPA